MYIGWTVIFKDVDGFTLPYVPYVEGVLNSKEPVKIYSKTADASQAFDQARLELEESLKGIKVYKVKKVLWWEYVTITYEPLPTVAYTKIKRMYDTLFIKQVKVA